MFVPTQLRHSPWEFEKVVSSPLLSPILCSSPLEVTLRKQVLLFSNIQTSKTIHLIWNMNSTITQRELFFSHQEEYHIKFQIPLYSYLFAF